MLTSRNFSTSNPATPTTRAGDCANSSFIATSASQMPPARPGDLSTCVKANPECSPVDGTGWHRHDCEFQIVIMMKGWARFMYEDSRRWCRPAMSCTSARASRTTSTITRPTWNSMEIVSPADFKTVDIAAGDAERPAGHALVVATLRALTFEIGPSAEPARVVPDLVRCGRRELDIQP